MNSTLAPLDYRRVGLLSVALGFALGSHGCAGANQGVSQGVSQGSVNSPITPAMIREISVMDAYEAVEQLRPTWLRRRGRASISFPMSNIPVVYLNGVRIQNELTSSLRQMDISGVKLIEFIGPADATTRFGTGHSGGIIAVQVGP